MKSINEPQYYFAPKGNTMHFLSFPFIYFACMYVSVHTTAYIWKSEKNLGSRFSPTRWVSGVEIQSDTGTGTPVPTSQLTGPNPCVFYDPWHLLQESQTASTATTGFCLFACLLLVLLGLNLESSTLEAKGSASELQPQLFIPTLDVRPWAAVSGRQSVTKSSGLSCGDRPLTKTTQRLNTDYESLASA